MLPTAASLPATTDAGLIPPSIVDPGGEKLLAAALAGMEPGWIVVRDCGLPPARPGQRPSRIPFTLLHPDFGIVLLEFLPLHTGDAARRMRLRLAAADLDGADRDRIPILHIQLERERALRLGPALDDALARRRGQFGRPSAHWLDSVLDVLLDRGGQAAAAVAAVPALRPEPPHPRTGRPRLLAVGGLGAMGLAAALLLHDVAWRPVPAGIPNAVLLAGGVAEATAVPAHHAMSETGDEPSETGNEASETGDEAAPSSSASSGGGPVARAEAAPANSLPAVLDGTPAHGVEAADTPAAPAEPAEDVGTPAPLGVAAMGDPAPDLSAAQPPVAEAPPDPPVPADREAPPPAPAAETAPAIALPADPVLTSGMATADIAPAAEPPPVPDPAQAAAPAEPDIPSLAQGRAPAIVMQAVLPGDIGAEPEPSPPSPVAQAEAPQPTAPDPEPAELVTPPLATPQAAPADTTAAPDPAVAAGTAPDVATPPANPAYAETQSPSPSVADPAPPAGMPPTPPPMPVLAAMPAPPVEEVAVPPAAPLPLIQATPPVAATPARSAPIAAAMSPALLAALIRRGDAMLALGDISAARLLYERAAAGGSGAAALAAGRSHDPAFLAEIGAQGLRADPDAAATWYRRALELGETAAAAPLRRLGQAP
jgi:hypothetical protein